MGMTSLVCRSCGATLQGTDNLLDAARDKGWQIDGEGNGRCKKCALLGEAPKVRLKPCPHCGEPEVRLMEHEAFAYVACPTMGCWMHGPVKESADAAVKAWDALPRKVESLPDAQLDALEKLAGEATPGPWATYGNSQEILGGQICSGWHDVYGLVDGEIWVLMAMNSNMVEEEERQLPATEKDVRRKYAPGQAGRNARYVAAANPAVVLALIAEVRRHRSADDD